MIVYKRGTVLDDDAEALVNTVNELGVMGKGVALEFKRAFPDSAAAYEEACRAGRVRVGRVLLTHHHGLSNPRYIIHFPTKKHWRYPSKLSWVRDGLKDLVRVVREYQIGSIALPSLGCGNGRLSWQDVRPLIEEAFAELPEVRVNVYEPDESTDLPRPGQMPSEDIESILSLLVLVQQCEAVGYPCNVLELHSLAWLLNRAAVVTLGEKLFDLGFRTNQYGPFADRLTTLLKPLIARQHIAPARLSEDELFEQVTLTSVFREHVHNAMSVLSDQPRRVLAVATSLIDQFESPHGLELLTSVDWLVTVEGVEPDANALRERLARWTDVGPAAAQRKLRLFGHRELEIALERLRSSGLLRGALPLTHRA